MKFFSILFLGAFTTLTAQVPNASIEPRPEAAKSPSAEVSRHVIGAAIPILGFVAGPGPLDLRYIAGVSSAPQLGPLIAVPESAKKLYLSPRQHYALVEQSSDRPLAVWALHRSSVTGGKEASAEKEAISAITGAFAHPSLVAFSPRGDSIAVYSATLEKIQILSGSARELSVERELPLAPGSVKALAVSDDGSIVAAVDADGHLQIAREAAAWQTLAATPIAFSFIPHTHDLLISDSAQKALLRWRLDEATTAPSVVAEGLQADRLAASKGGDFLIAADTARDHLWTIDLNTGAVTGQQEKVDRVISLRDGHAFLLSHSATAALSILKFPDSAHPASPIVRSHIASPARDDINRQ
jgi:hypothetical protein